MSPTNDLGEDYDIKVEELRWVNKPCGLPESYLMLNKSISNLLLVNSSIFCDPTNVLEFISV